MPTNIYHHISPPQVWSRDHPNPKATQITHFSIVRQHQDGHRPSRPRYFGQHPGKSSGPCLQTFTTTLANLKCAHFTTHVENHPEHVFFIRVTHYALSRRPPTQQAEIFRPAHWQVTWTMSTNIYHHTSSTQATSALAEIGGHLLGWWPPWYCVTLHFIHL